jgi:Trk-type K+ transport system membrane component
MSIFTYAQIYLGLGIFFMLVLDLMHQGIKNAVDDETFEKNRYTNAERLYVVFLWPIVIYSLLTVAFGFNTMDDLVKKEEELNQKIKDLKDNEDVEDQA